MSADRQVSACIIIIGNELLSGRTQDVNLKYLGEALGGVGVQLAEARIIPDDEETIIATVNECRTTFDYVFTTGGIGPTHDDITSKAIAAAFGVGLEQNADALSRLRKHYNRKKLNEARLKMAYVPVGASLIDNPVSRAPGFRIENVFVLAGVPRIMQAMFDGIKGQLAGGVPVKSLTLSAYVKEGDIAAELGDIQQNHVNVEIGSYPFFLDGKLGASMVVRGRDTVDIEAAAAAIRTLIQNHGKEPIPDEER